MPTVKLIRLFSSFILAVVLQTNSTSTDRDNHENSSSLVSHPTERSPSGLADAQPEHVLRLQNYLRTSGPVCQAWISQDTQINHSRTVLTNSPYIARLLRVALETKSVIYLKSGPDNDLQIAGFPSPGMQIPQQARLQQGLEKNDFGSYDVRVLYLQAVSLSNAIGYSALVRIGDSPAKAQKPDVWTYTNDSIIGDVLELAVKSDIPVQMEAAGDGRIKSVWLPAQ